MRTCELYTGAAQLRDAFEELQTLWAEVSADWNDDASRKFCRDELEPLGPTVKLSMEALSRMTQVVQQMHRECNEPTDN